MRSSVVLLAALVLGGCGAQQVQGAELGVLAEPNSVEAWVLLGDTYRRAGEREKATAAYERALSLSPDNPEILSRLQQSGSRQLSELEQNALLNPLDDEVWGDLGDEYALRGQREKALEYYLYALKIDPADYEWQQKVVEHGGLDQIIGTYEAQLSGTDDEAIGDVADMLRQGGEEERACELYARANELDPGDSEWLENLSTCPGHTPVALPYDAYDSYAHGVELGTAGGVVGGVLGGGDPSLFELGREALDAGDADEARELFERALLADPTDRNATAGLIAVTGKTLVEVLTALSERQPDNDELWGDLGDARLATGDREGALEAFRQAGRLDPGDSEWQSKTAVLEAAAQATDQ